MTLSGMVDAAPMPIIVSNSDTGKVYLANAAARALFAAPDGSLDTITPEEFYEDPAQRATLLARLAGTGTVENFAASLTGRDGRRLDMRINARRVRFQDEDALCVILRDVTDQTRVEARHRAVLSHLDAGVMMYDGTGVITYANPAAERLLARPSGTLPGTPFASLTKSTPPLAEVLGGGFSVDGALVALDTISHGSGAVTWVRASASPLAEDGFPGSVVCSLYDVTNLKAAEDALNDSSDALRTVLSEANETDRRR
ncbi:MAG: PAS domain-containing protein [Rhodospirillaceae bacterium]